MERLPSRRDFLRVVGGVTAGLAATIVTEPAAATPAAMQDAIRKIVGSARVGTGRVKLELPPLVENGNTVPLAVSVESPMTEADHVTGLHIFNQKNPQPYVAVFHLGPRAGIARVSTRIDRKSVV